MALTIMAIHPHPSSGILLPYMDSNLAQITRTWIASALLTGQVAIPSQHLQPATDLSSSRSIPCYLIPWSTVSPTNLSHSNPPHDANSSNKSKVRQDRNNRQRKISPVSTARTPPRGSAPVNKSAISLPKQNPHQVSIQTTLYDAFKLPPPPQQNQTDKIWGHCPAAITDNTVLRVMFSNPKGLKLSTDILETEHSFGRVHSLNTGLLGLAETNVNWHHPRVLGKFHKSLRKVWKHTALSTSSTKADFQSEIQPGGTITLACGHWTLRVLQKGVDPFGLGRWSYLTLRGNQGRKILVITAYRVCRQSIQSVGPKTSAAH